MELILALLLLLLSPFLNFSGLHPISSPARSSRPTSINSFINAVRIDSVRERGRLGARQQSESSGCTATKVRQESERGRPQNPFQSPEQISFPFSGLSVLPSSLPPSPRHSLSHPLWNAARTLLRALSTGWHLPHLFRTRHWARQPCLWLGRPAVIRTRSLGLKLQFRAFLPGCPIWAISSCSAVNHLSLHMGTSSLPPSLPPSAAADLSGSGLARVTSPPKWEREEGRGRR